MAVVLNRREYVEAFSKGRFFTSHFRKVPGLASVAYWWSDLSMAAGNPLANYYASAPLIASVMNGWEGIFHGDNKSPEEMYLSSLMVCANSANCIGLYTLLDYLLYYPFIDGDSTDLQEMNNNVTLPRYTDGNGVMAMYVAQAPTVGGGRFTFDYYNQNGVLKTSPINYLAGAANMGSLMTTQPANTGGMGRFLRLASGDTGIRSIVSVTNLVVNGGLGVIVLVKPIADITVSEANVPTEMTYMNYKQMLPKIMDGAYLNFICNTAGSIATTVITGKTDFIWN